MSSGKIAGGSYAGQAGSCEDVFNNHTYGTYDDRLEVANSSLEIPDTSLFLGSGGGVNSADNQGTKGGGAIVLRSQVFNLLGMISASGYP